MYYINSVFTHAAVAGADDLYIMCRYVCDHLHTMPSSSGSFVIAIKPNAKKMFA